MNSLEQDIPRGCDGAAVGNRCGPVQKPGPHAGGDAGLDRQQQVRIATAVSEIARNAFRYAEGSASGLRPPSTATCRSEAPRIAHDDHRSRHRHHGTRSGARRHLPSKTGMGAGIRGVKRLMDRVEIDDGAGTGTTVKAPSKSSSAGAVVKETALQKAHQEIAKTAPASPIEELAAQNQNSSRRSTRLLYQRSELEQINEELSETNRGVVALVRRARHRAPSRDAWWPRSSIWSPSSPPSPTRPRNWRRGIRRVFPGGARRGTLDLPDQGGTPRARA